ncbi:MAG: phage head morphogenesis protein [Lawsonibacter sp.]|nr:phage head morphogenesis protein [Lawsonibacter sp.]
MYINKICGCVFIESRGIKSMVQLKGLLDTYTPKTSKSALWKYWKATLDPKLCLECASHHGKIYAINEIPNIEPPLHPNCRCIIDQMDAIMAGEATKDGENGADYWLFYHGQLPDYYISEDELRSLGWKNGKPPKRYAPGKMLFGGIYDNDDGHLPSVAGRIWYEADINYYEGRRNRHRILFSNDGLVFVTYDRYMTFYEVYIGGAA